LVIDGVHSTYMLMENQNHHFFATARIPVCLSDNSLTIALQEKDLTVTCELYESVGTILLLNMTTNCSIPSNTMSYPNSYMIKFTATNPNDNTMTTIRWSYIEIKTSRLSWFINGGDRDITVDRDNSFVVNAEPKSNNLIYRWGCYEQLSGSFCLSPNSTTYLNFRNSPSMTIPSGSLFPNRGYRISCTVIDPDSGKTAKSSTFIAAKSGEILDVTINSRHNKNGYIDYTYPSLFVCETMLSGAKIAINNATYTWAISDSLGNTVALPVNSTVLNSLRLPAETLVSQTKKYLIGCTVSYSSKTGTASIRYSTEFETLYSFVVEPVSGVGLVTEFVMAVVSQSYTFEINNFIFGYIKEGKKYLLTRSSPDPLYTVFLPQGETLNALTVFAEVHNQEGKVYYLQRTITVTAPTLLASAFNTLVNSTNAMSIEDSINIRLQYKYLNASISPIYKLQAANLMLDGLLKDGKAFIISSLSLYF
jgi:uncharacterized protein Veg